MEAVSWVRWHLGNPLGWSGDGSGARERDFRHACLHLCPGREREGRGEAAKGVGGALSSCARWRAELRRRTPGGLGGQPTLGRRGQCSWRKKLGCRAGRGGADDTSRGVFPGRTGSQWHFEERKLLRRWLTPWRVERGAGSRGAPWDFGAKLGRPGNSGRPPSGGKQWKGEFWVQGDVQSQGACFYHRHGYSSRPRKGTHVPTSPKVPRGRGGGPGFL